MLLIDEKLAEISEILGTRERETDGSRYPSSPSGYHPPPKPVII
jgi:hypothetical protein